ncbi:hypothetical protein ACJJTC_018669 [Scirpophaga incertulas]
MSNRPTTIQLEALVEFLEQHPAIARGFLKTALGKQESKRKWAEIAMSLNSLGGVIKDGPAWAKYWAEKNAVLKNNAHKMLRLLDKLGEELDIPLSFQSWIRDLWQ